MKELYGLFVKMENEKDGSKPDAVMSPGTALIHANKEPD